MSKQSSLNHDYKSVKSMLMLRDMSSPNGKGLWLFSQEETRRFEDWHAFSGAVWKNTWLSDGEDNLTSLETSTPEANSRH